MDRCSHCNSLNVNYFGTKYGKDIYECYDCGKVSFKKERKVIPPMKS